MVKAGSAISPHWRAAPHRSEHALFIDAGRMRAGTSYCLMLCIWEY